MHPVEIGINSEDEHFFDQVRFKKPLMWVVYMTDNANLLEYMTSLQTLMSYDQELLTKLELVLLIDNCPSSNFGMILNTMKRFLRQELGKQLNIELDLFRCWQAQTNCLNFTLLIKTNALTTGKLQSCLFLFELIQSKYCLEYTPKQIIIQESNVLLPLQGADALLPESVPPACMVMFCRNVQHKNPKNVWGHYLLIEHLVSASTSTCIARCLIKQSGNAHVGVLIYNWQHKLQIMEYYTEMVHHNCQNEHILLTQLPKHHDGGGVVGKDVTLIELNTPDATQILCQIQQVKFDSLNWHPGCGWAYIRQCFFLLARPLLGMGVYYYTNNVFDDVKYFSFIDFLIELFLSLCLIAAFCSRFKDAGQCMWCVRCLVCFWWCIVSLFFLAMIYATLRLVVNGMNQIDREVNQFVLILYALYILLISFSVYFETNYPKLVLVKALFYHMSTQVVLDTFFLFHSVCKVTQQLQAAHTRDSELRLTSKSEFSKAVLNNNDTLPHAKSHTARTVFLLYVVFIVMLGSMRIGQIDFLGQGLSLGFVFVQCVYGSFFLYGGVVVIVNRVMSVLDDKGEYMRVL